MKILFWGGGKGSSGPANVSNSYRAALTESFVLVKSSHKYGELVEAVWKLLFCECVVISGVSRKGTLLVGFARIFGKKSVYIMHGCAEYECEINKTTCSWQGLTQEQYLLKYSTLILAVSKKYRYWVHNRYPQYADKTDFLYNGIEKVLLPEGAVFEKRANSVIAAGGNRIQKANNVLAAAIDSMHGAVRLEIYGDLDGPVYQGEYAKYMGPVCNEQFYQKLAQAQLFVLNSIVESFSVATIEALMCGCSVLVSESAGVTDLLTLEEMDVIHDPMDKEEICRKIKYLLEHPNNERILASLDLEEYSYPRQTEKLEQICRDLIQKTV